jgi:hypothetical protein
MVISGMVAYQPFWHKGVSMHEHNPEPGHIPPPDLPRHRTVLGFRPHIFIGGLVLIAILFIYLLLLVRRPVFVPEAQPKAAPTSSYSPSIQSSLDRGTQRT